MCIGMRLWWSGGSTYIQSLQETISGPVQILETSLANQRKMRIYLNKKNVWIGYMISRIAFALPFRIHTTIRIVRNQEGMSEWWLRILDLCVASIHVTFFVRSYSRVIHIGTHVWSQRSGDTFVMCVATVTAPLFHCRFVLFSIS